MNATTAAYRFVNISYSFFLNLQKIREYFKPVSKLLINIVFLNKFSASNLEIN